MGSSICFSMHTSFPTEQSPGKACQLGCPLLTDVIHFPLSLGLDAATSVQLFCTAGGETEARASCSFPSTTMETQHQTLARVAPHEGREWVPQVNLLSDILFKGPQPWSQLFSDLTSRFSERRGEPGKLCYLPSDGRKGLQAIPGMVHSLLGSSYGLGVHRKG